jgi:hypothetical protein
LNQAVFLEAAGVVLKIGLSLKPNRHREILPKFMKRSVPTDGNNLKLPVMPGISDNARVI